MVTGSRHTGLTPPPFKANIVKFFFLIEYFNLLVLFASLPLCTGLKIRRGKKIPKPVSILFAGDAIAACVFLSSRYQLE